MQAWSLYDNESCMQVGKHVVCSRLDLECFGWEWKTSMFVHPRCYSIRIMGITPGEHSREISLFDLLNHTHPGDPQ